MSHLVTQPQLMTAAAEDLVGIQTSIAEASIAVGGRTTGLAAAAADEVSAAIADVFSVFGEDYQAFARQVETYHNAFVQTLTASANAYGHAEADAQALLSGSTAASGGAPSAQATLQGTTFGWMIGGSGNPIPSQTYVTKVLSYVNEAFGVLPENAKALFTPEGLQPIYTGIKSLPLNTSVDQGVQILDQTIKSTLAAHPGDSVAVLGYSLSAIISSLEIRDLMNPALNPTPPLPTELGFTLLGNPMNPNGGLLSRFVGLNVPSLGLDFYGSTPPDTPLSDQHLHAPVRRIRLFPAVPAQSFVGPERLLGNPNYPRPVPGSRPSKSSPRVRDGHTPGLSIPDRAGPNQLLHDHAPKPADHSAVPSHPGHR